MVATEMTRLQANIEEIRSRIAESERELENCRPFRRGTQWFVDRVNELNYLRIKLADLEAREAAK